jgi:hypothetical protein
MPLGHGLPNLPAMCASHQNTTILSLQNIHFQPYHAFALSGFCIVIFPFLSPELKDEVNVKEVLQPPELEL